MITRDISKELLLSAAEYPVATILGPRQSGKTTLARMTFPDKPYFSLEDPDVRLAAEVDPRGFLGQMEGGAILDEVQRVPALLSYIQGIVDKGRGGVRFILTGSHQPRLHEAISQSLAGRTAMLTLWPFSLRELQRYGTARRPFDLIVRGFFPRLHDEGLEPRRLTRWWGTPPMVSSSCEGCRRSVSLAWASMPVGPKPPAGMRPTTEMDFKLPA